ncbi:MAG: hypothetical protein M3X11_25055, partial [Acidobacteriota bacterium]|nr:hypothetical protein [Acidobacteriota bacterium]
PLLGLWGTQRKLTVCATATERFADSGWNPSWPDFAGLAASFGTFLWTHPPTAYQFVLVFGTCVAVPAIRAGKWRELGWIVLSLIFGSMLAATYFYPAIAEQRLVNYDDVARAWPYHTSYVFDFSQNVYDRADNPFFVRLDRVWAFNLAVILICLLAAFCFRARQPRVQVGLWASAGLLACFLMTKYSALLGRLIPKIEIGVFSWRMLALSSFAVAMLAGAVCSTAFRQQDSVKQALPPEGGTTNVWRLAVTGSILLATLATSAWYVVWPMWRGQAFEPNPEHYNYATLPHGAPRDNPPMPPVQLISGNGSITVEWWTPEFRQLRVQLNEPDQLQFRTRNFAGWTATVDGNVSSIHEGAVKNILVDLPAGDHRITLEFRSTPVRRAGNWVTVVSLVALLSIVIIATRRK